MNIQGTKWITCFPVAFRGDEQTFFRRDAGLCCRTLQRLGAQASVVMPEPLWDDSNDLIRVPYARLSDPEFWRSQAADAVILYSWAEPKYTPIAEAIYRSGTRLYLNVDTGGLFSLFVEPSAYIRGIFALECGRHGRAKGLVRAAVRLAGSLVRIDRHLSRIRHLAMAHAVGVPSPIAAERIRKYALFFGRKDVARKTHFVSHPVNPSMCYSGVKKQETVVAVGRWNDHAQKRPELLIDVAVKVLREHLAVRFVLAGSGAAECAVEIARRVPEAQERVSGYERLEHERLCELLNSAQVSLCTSRYESFHIASGEALLCGCSIVAPSSPHLPSLPYFVESGRFGAVCSDTPANIADAVISELAEWKSGRRNAVEIAGVWRKRIAADAVVRQINAHLFK